ncbi:uncharacterized protein Aud_006984 [Aspergillus udagawae]|uniref:Uncharacterized protein n=1 Tax=Aspergillus udagawae TaxID=91492 RepID=A0A8E0QSX7_9EURO|nr:uncharacterized protein Aud_006984 [Aspergillus udagawae]GIC90549.1 hypothetical protein Aud_006984 [Aspergillus udagawae]
MPPSTDPQDNITTSGPSEPSQPNGEQRSESVPAGNADAAAERELRREEKRRARRRREQARYILRKLETGQQTLYLQEVYVQSSHCRAWERSIAKVTREPNIRSYYRFALKGGRNSYGGDLVEYYHITCMERLIRNLGDLAANGYLKIDGRVSLREEGKVSEKCAWEVIQDWFKYGGRTFDIECYERFEKGKEKWSEDSYDHCVRHSLTHKAAEPVKDCWYCEGAPPEPAKRDYCPGEPNAIRLSQLLLAITGLPHIDHWWLWSREERGGGGVRDPA